MKQPIANGSKLSRLLLGKIGEIVKQEAMREAVTAANTSQQDAGGSILKKRDNPPRQHLAAPE